MTRIRSHISVSLDGFVAGRDQSFDEPLGEGGERLHDWAVNAASWRRQHGQEGGEDGPDSRVGDEVARGIGAYIMGRNMFGPPGGGEWDASWTGWWGEDPPFHAPVYVLTHHPREPIEMQGGTSYHFVTDGIEAALEQARAAAGDQDVLIAGGADVLQQYLAAGLLEELHLHIVPIMLRSGARLFENVGDPSLEPVEVVASPAATHVKYRVSYPRPQERRA